jgi:hypothetical protein
VGVASGSGHSQFEPVSPDEDERPASEGIWHRIARVCVGIILPYTQYHCNIDTECVNSQ